MSEQKMRAADVGLSAPSLAHSVYRIQAVDARIAVLSEQERLLREGPRLRGRYVFDAATYDEAVSAPLSFELEGLAEATAAGYDEALIREATSEAVHHLRCALDHLVYNLAWLDAGTPNERSQFVLRSSDADWARATTDNQLSGISAPHLEVLREYQPEPVGRCRWTKRLADLNNTDKHRFLVAPRRQTDWLLDWSEVSVTTDQNDPTRLVGYDDPGPPELVLPGEGGGTPSVVLAEISHEVSLLLTRFLPVFGEDTDVQFAPRDQVRRESWWVGAPPAGLG